MNSRDLNLALAKWGKWKRQQTAGASFGSSTIEAQIISGEIFGTGNIGGGYNPETINHIDTSGDEVSSAIDRCVRKMVESNRILAGVLVASYVFKWSVNKVADETGRSRYLCTNDLKTSKHVLNALLEHEQGSQRYA